MSKKAMESNKVINGSHGMVWMDDTMMGNVKSFEAKATLNYEAVKIAGDMGEYQKYMGWTGAGTMTLHKIDSYVAGKLAGGIKSGNMPEIKMVAKLADPAAYGHERVELSGVTFDEVTLIKFANSELGEEEVPFKFSDYNFLDMI